MPIGQAIMWQENEVFGWEIVSLGVGWRQMSQSCACTWHDWQTIQLTWVWCGRTSTQDLLAPFWVLFLDSMGNG